MKSVEDFTFDDVKNYCEGDFREEDYKIRNLVMAWLYLGKNSGLNYQQCGEILDCMEDCNSDYALHIEYAARYKRENKTFKCPDRFVLCFTKGGIHCGDSEVGTIDEIKSAQSQPNNSPGGCGVECLQDNERGDRCTIM